MVQLVTCVLRKCTQVTPTAEANFHHVKILDLQNYNETQ